MAQPSLGNAITFIIDGQSYSKTVNGNSATIKGHVTDIVAPEGANTTYAIYAGGIPRIGDIFPHDHSIFVTSVVSDGVPASPTQASITITYGIQASTGPSFFQNDPEDGISDLEVSTTLQTVQTNLDVNGETIFVDYTPRIPDAGAGTKKTQGGMVSVQVPLTTLTYRRREFKVTTVDGEDLGISTKAQRFVGNVNTEPVFGGVSFVWLCSRINASSDDGQNTMNVTYEFIKAPQRRKDRVQTWDAVVVYIDPETNRPPKDADEGNGVKSNIPMYLDQDFTLLGIDV